MKILLSGATGRVGSEIERLATAGDDPKIVDRASTSGFFSADADADVLIDFSRPQLCARSLAFARGHRLPMVIGTTGIGAELQETIKQAAGEIPVCQAANFSVGVNLLMDLVARAAAGLPASFDIEIAEMHHRWKVDAPSGTALMLGRAAAGARGADVDNAGVVRGDGARQPGRIGFQVARGGDVPGEHTVLFLGNGERVELTHRVTDRSIFARGALHAARWLIGRAPGLYSMREVLAPGDTRPA